MAGEVFDLGRVIQTAEAIKGARRESVMDRLRQQYLGAQIDSMGQQQRLAEQAGQIQQAQEARAQQQFTAEQQFTNTRTLNAAAKGILADPSSIGAWSDVLKQQGVIGADFDPTTVDTSKIQQIGEQLAKRTDAVLSAYLKSNPAMAEVDARHQATLAEIQARINGESGLASQQNQYSLQQIRERGAQDMAVEAAKGPGRDTRTAQALRKEFEGLQTVQNYRAVEPLIKSAEQSPDNGAGDLNLIYAVGKILDPGSVVREGELQLVVDSASPLQKILGKTRFNFEKGGRLPPQQRKQLIDMLKGRAGAIQESYQREAQRYGSYAQEAGLSPEAVIGSQQAQSQPNQVRRVRVDASGNVIQ